jgi:anti-sigma factor RsiW
MNMPARERIVSGLSCSDVLALLSDYVDGTLDAAARENVDAHLRGCNWCEEFGGRFSDVVEKLRRSLAASDPLDGETLKRFNVALRLKR